MTECRSCERLRERIRILEARLEGTEASREHWFKMFAAELKANLGLTDCVSTVRLPSGGNKGENTQGGIE